MKVTVQIPTLNEGESLAHTLKQIPREVVDEVLVIDGHSTDNTREVAESFGCRFLLQPGKGYGNAMKFGFQNASGDVIISMDADGSPNPQDIPRLVAKLKEGYDLVLGSRYLPGAGTEDDTLVRHVGNKFFTFLTNFIHGTKISDSCYFFAAMRKEMLLKLDLKTEDFSFCIEVPVKARKAGFKIAEIPCFERKRVASTSRVNAIRDGLKILRAILTF